MRGLFLLLLLGAADLLAQNSTHVDLSGEWRKSSDDATRYADPAFDDRSWETVRLPWTSSQPYGVYWLRRQASLPAGAESRDLALTLGTVNEIYEVFVNGAKIGSTGELNTRDLQIARPRTFPIPRDLVRSGRPPVIAIRVWRPYYGLFSGRMSINNRGPYWITDQATVPKEAAWWVVNERWTRQSTDFVTGAVEVTLGILILLAWQSNRPRRELLWLGLFLLFDAIQRITVVSQISLTSHPEQVNPLLQLISALNFGFQFELCVAVSGFRHRWLRPAGWLLVVIGLSAQPFGRQFNVSLRGSVILMAAGILLLAIIRAWRTQRTWNRLGLIALILAEVVARMSRVGFLGRQRTGFIEWGDVSWEPQGLILLLTGFGAALLLILELLSDRREKQRLASELEAGRAVQSLLLGEQKIRGADAVYLPAAEVGGDFWHLMGDRLVVIGDVSGKGLKAAMVVSLITGALRNRRADSPAALLTELNAVVQGSAGFVTCCIVRLESAGQITVANAGHPAPYMAGRELDLAPGLPLGVTPDAEYVDCVFALDGPLTLVSDGVIEAANAKGELFGFERTREISTKSAIEIAEAARVWGQNDDITVVTVRRTA